MLQKASNKAVIFGAGGRVGLQLAQGLLSRGIDVVAIDVLPQAELDARLARVSIDLNLLGFRNIGRLITYPAVDVLNQSLLADIIDKESPDIVINYSIPFTWDATKTLANYQQISKAGLGAFAPIQALAPMTIAKVLAETGSQATFVVGNLPDVTIPILYGLASSMHLKLPLAGAGNVGLIEAAIRHQILCNSDLQPEHLCVYLVCHHVHWVAPREPGYPNNMPFRLKITHKGDDISETFGDLRQLMNNAIVGCYEPGAGFSTTTGLLAARLVAALVDDSGTEQGMHVPSPNGLPGGYPVIIKDRTITPSLPTDWDLEETSQLMREVHRGDGIASINDDGSIDFMPESITILKQEMGIELPAKLHPEDLESFAKEQIRIAQSL